MTNHNVGGHTTATLVLPWLLGALLIFAPLFRAGQGPIPLLVLQLSVVLLLLLSLWTPATSRIFTRSAAIALGLLLLYPILFIVPLPGLPMDWLPGRDRSAATLALIESEQIDRATTLSIYPIETRAA